MYERYGVRGVRRGKTIDDIRASVPPKGLLDPSLRQGYGAGLNKGRIIQSTIGRNPIAGRFGNCGCNRNYREY